MDPGLRRVALPGQDGEQFIWLRGMTTFAVNFLSSDQRETAFPLYTLSGRCGRNCDPGNRGGPSVACQDANAERRFNAL